MKKQINLKWYFSVVQQYIILFISLAYLQLKIILLKISHHEKQSLLLFSEIPIVPDLPIFHFQKKRWQIGVCWQMGGWQIGGCTVIKQS